MPNSIETQGSILSVSDGGSPSLFSAIGNLLSFSGPSGGASVIDVTNLSSVAKEKRLGLIDWGEFSCELNYDPDNATHQQIRNAIKNRTRLEFKMALTDTTPTNLVFFAYVSKFQTQGAVDGVVKLSIALQIDGDISWV